MVPEGLVFSEMTGTGRVGEKGEGLSDLTVMAGRMEQNTGEKRTFKTLDLDGEIMLRGLPRDSE